MQNAAMACTLAAVMPWVCAAQSKAPLQVTAVRYWSLADVTRVAVETNGEFHYRFDRLHNPDRLFFDLEGARPRVIPGKGIHTIPVDDRLLKRMRVAENQPGTTRVVLDLESGVEFVASQLKDPDRLMIELRLKAAPGKPAAPAVAPSVTGVEKLPPARPEPEKTVAAGLSLPSRTPDTQKDSGVVPPKPEPPARREPSSGAGGPEPAAGTETPRRMERGPEPAPATLSPAPVKTPPPALAAKRTSTGRRTLIRTLGLKLGRVVLDPGHGGYDHGSTGPGGLVEKDLVLDIAKRLGALLEERLGTEVIYTRSDDSFESLESRTGLANEKKADLFLSIHANSSPYPSVAGVETYYLNFTTSRDALEVAARENAPSQLSIHELAEIIQKITLHDKLAESREFAGKMQTSLWSASRVNPSARNRGIKKAPFVVLIGAQMPSILTEIGFISNPKEEALFKKPEHRQRIAEGLYRGVSRYAETLSRFQVARAKD